MHTIPVPGLIYGSTVRLKEAVNRRIQLRKLKISDFSVYKLKRKYLFVS